MSTNVLYTFAEEIFDGKLKTLQSFPKTYFLCDPVCISCTLHPYSISLFHLGPGILTKQGYSVSNDSKLTFD